MSNNKKDFFDVFNWSSKWLLIGITLGITLLWIIWMSLWFKFNSNPASAGQFGDWFGALGTLFAGISLVLIIYTIRLQHKEMENSIGLLTSQLRLLEEKIKREKDEREKSLVSNFMYHNWRPEESHGNKQHLAIEFRNKGGTIYNVKVNPKFEESDKGHIDSRIQGSDEIYRISFDLKQRFDPIKTPEINFEITYKDAETNDRTDEYKLIVEEIKDNGIKRHGDLIKI